MSISLAVGPLDVETEAASKVESELEFCSRRGDGGSDRGESARPGPTVSPIDSPIERDMPEDVGFSFFGDFVAVFLRGLENRRNPASASLAGFEVLKSRSTMSVSRGNVRGLALPATFDSMSLGSAAGRGRNWGRCARGSNPGPGGLVKRVGKGWASRLKIEVIAHNAMNVSGTKIGRRLSNRTVKPSLFSGKFTTRGQTYPSSRSRAI